MTTRADLVRTAQNLADVAQRCANAERVGTWERVSPARTALAAAYAAYMAAMRSVFYPETTSGT